MTHQNEQNHEYLAKVQHLVNRISFAGQRMLWQRRYNPDKISVPVFLVGCGRSGTTMVLRHIGQSLEVDTYNENDETAFSQWRLKELPVIEKIVEASSARIVVFKPILNTTQTLAFLSYFPTAKIIFIYRNFDDVINSSMKKFGSGNRMRHVRDWVTDDFLEFSFAPPPPSTRQVIRDLWLPDLSESSGAALYWLFYNRLYFDMGLHNQERVLLKGYEAIVAEPDVHFRSICDHVGVTYDEKFIEGIFPTSVGRDPAPDVDYDIHRQCEGLYQQLERQMGSIPAAVGNNPGK